MRISELLAFSIIVLPAQAIAATPISDRNSPIIVYQTEEAYDDIKTNLELAITGRGMSITSTLHISDMLERTAADTGLKKKLYDQAESLEFCSIKMSFQMSLAHPANMATCPLTISLYTTPEDPNHTYIAFRRPKLLNDNESVGTTLLEMLDGIVQESLE